MSVNTANFLGRYAIVGKNQDSERSESLIDRVVDKGFKKYRQRQKKAADSILARTETESEKLIHITDGARDNLITASTVFPFVLFPDTVSIDRQKLTIVHRSFFRTSSTICVQIDDVQIAKVDVGPFFGSVHLASKYFVDNIQSINFLRRSDAIKIQRLLQGYMIAHHRQIDCSGIDNDQLVILLNQLGQSSTS
jgi:hypothetical protein